MQKTFYLFHLYPISISISKMRKLRHSRLNNLPNTIQAVGGGAETETSISSELEVHAPNRYMIQNPLGRDQMSVWMLVGSLGSVENI